MDKLTIELPWPSNKLSPNHKKRWEKIRAVASYRHDCYYCTKEQIKTPLKWNKVGIHWKFYPPAKYNYDDDNLEGRMKSGRDGIADAIKVDDKHFKATREICEIVKYGKVVAELQEIGSE